MTRIFQLSEDGRRVRSQVPGLSTKWRGNRQAQVGDTEAAPRQGGGSGHPRSPTRSPRGAVCGEVVLEASTSWPGSPGRAGVRAGLRFPMPRGGERQVGGCRGQQPKVGNPDNSARGWRERWGWVGNEQVGRGGRLGKALRDARPCHLRCVVGLEISHWALLFPRVGLFLTPWTTTHQPSL